MEKVGKPQRVRKMQLTRGSQGGPLAGMREMMQKRMSGVRGGGRGQGGPKARGESRGGRCEKCGAEKSGGAQRIRGGDGRRGGRTEKRGNRGNRR